MGCVRWDPGAWRAGVGDYAACVRPEDEIYPDQLIAQGSSSGYASSGDSSAGDSAGPSTSGGCLESPSGNCYRAGELCPAADHGLTAQGSSGPIVCTDNNGWRWENA